MVGLISFCRSLLDKFIKNLRILGSSLFWSLKNTHFFKIFFIFLYTHLVYNVEILAYFTFLDFWKFEGFFCYLMNFLHFFSSKLFCYLNWLNVLLKLEHTYYTIHIHSSRWAVANPEDFGCWYTGLGAWTMPEFMKNS